MPVEKWGTDGGVVTTRLYRVAWLGLTLVSACNLAPEGGIVAVEPADPRTDDALMAVFEIEPDDKQPITFSYAWSVDGAASAEHTTNTVPASATAKGQTWSVVVTATDERGASVAFEADTLVLNTPPVVDTVTMTPTSFDASSTLTAAATGSDADGDDLTWTYTWYVGKEQVQSGPAETLAGSFVGGDTVRVEAVANDGTDDSIASDASGVAGNTAPTITGAHIEPKAPTSLDTLACVADGESDIDGDTVSYTTTWTVDGKGAGTSAALDPKAFARGANVACTTTPTDGQDAGTAASASAVTILNAAPTVGNVAISPSPFYTANTLEASFDKPVDSDGDAVSLSFSWSVDGKVVSTAPSLPSANHSRDSVVELTVTATDKIDSRVESASGITQNTAPAMPSVSLSCADLDQDLTCYADSTDDDGDVLTYTVEWMVDGKPWGGKTTTSTITGDTVPAAELSDGEIWTCAARADDGIEESDESEREAEVKDWQGEVMRTDGTWACAQYEVCGTGTTCTAADAKDACEAVGLRVASHASDDTDDVASLGATNSCYWSVSYYINTDKMAASDCLVGISNLDWSDCCGLNQWHGNTMPFGAPDEVFGYVHSSSTGLVNDYPNVSGSNWGCNSLTTPASVLGTCTDLLVACTE